MENATSKTVTNSDIFLDKTYWNNQYANQQTGWDLGLVSPPIKNYIDTITNKNCSILIPGCGNAYEAEYLLHNGFTNITVVDISPFLIEKLQDKFKNNSNITILNTDFFRLTQQFDVIIEQTFFCALLPYLRPQYVYKMHQLLAPHGKLIGLLFNRSFSNNPPFGGSASEYENLFKHAFTLSALVNCTTSAKPRNNTEIFIEFVKNSEVNLQLYQLKGITTEVSKKAVADIFLLLENVLHLVISDNLATILMVSNKPIDVNLLKQAIAYNNEYLIETFKN